jgi:hypothetical protein
MSKAVEVALPPSGISFEVQAAHVVRQGGDAGMVLPKSFSSMAKAPLIDLLGLEY